MEDEDYVELVDDGGEKTTIRKYKNTKQEVEDAWFPPDGNKIAGLNMLSIEQYENDVLFRSKKGDEECWYYTNGMLESIETKDFYKEYDPDGDLIREIHFKDGKKHGVEASYMDGKPTSYYVHYNGECIQAGNNVINQELSNKLKEGK